MGGRERVWVEVSTKKMMAHNVLNFNPGFVGYQQGSAVRICVILLYHQKT